MDRSYLEALWPSTRCVFDLAAQPTFSRFAPWKAQHASVAE
jgi:hypothetical protein